MAYITADEFLDVNPDAIRIANSLSNGDAVVEASNSISGENDGVQATSGQRGTIATNEANGKAALHFAGDYSNTVTQWYDFDDILVGRTELTVQFLVKMLDADGTNGGHIWKGKQAAGDDVDLLRYNGSDTFYLTFGSTARKVNGSTIPFDWTADYHLLTIVSKAGEYSVYLDDDNTPFFTTATNTFAAHSSFWLGRYDGSYGVHSGHYKTLRLKMYDKAFDASEVAQNVDAFATEYELEQLGFAPFVEYSETIYNINGSASGDIHAGSELSITGGASHTFSGTLVYTDSLEGDSISNVEFPDATVKTGLRITSGDLVVNLSGLEPNSDLYLEPVFASDDALLNFIVTVNGRKVGYGATGYTTLEVRRLKIWTKADEDGNAEVKFTGFINLCLLKVGIGTFEIEATTLIVDLGDSIKVPYRDEHKSPLLRLVQNRGLSNVDYGVFDSFRRFSNAPIRAVNMSVSGISTGGQVAKIADEITPRFAEHTYTRKVALISTGANDSGSAATIYAGYVTAKTAYLAAGFTEVYICAPIPKSGTGGAALMNDVAELCRDNWVSDGFDGLIDHNIHSTWSDYPEGAGDNPNYRDDGEDSSAGGFGLHLDEAGLVVLGADYIADTTLIEEFEAEDSEAPTTPGTPTFASVAANAYTVNWTAATDNVAVTNYDLLKYASDGTTLLATYNLGNVLTYAATGLTPSTTYKWKVRAKDAFPNYSSYSSLGTQATTSDSTVPNNVGTVTPTVISTSQINLNWADVSDNVGVTEYLIEYDTENTFTGASQTTSATSAKNITGLMPDTLYYFRIKAKDAANNYSAAWSSTVSATTSESEIPPEDFTWNYWQLPEFYFPSEFNWETVTRTHEYEDGGMSFNELNSVALQTWEIHYAPVDRDGIGAAMRLHFNTYRISRVFNFIAKDGETYTNVRYKSFETSYPTSNLSQTQRIKIVLVKYP